MAGAIDAGTAEAGVALDLAVALDVMGWGPLQRDLDDAGNRVRHEVDRYPFLEMRTWVGVTTIFACEPHLRVHLSAAKQIGWRPSEVLEHAWLVLGHFGYRATIVGPHAGAGISDDANETDEWVVELPTGEVHHSHTTTWQDTVMGSAGTIELAICRAALLAVRGRSK